MADSTNIDTEGFQFSVSGGLNTASARLTMPGEDSPALMNMEVNDNGTLSKRFGFDFWNNSLETAAAGKLRMTQVGENVSYSAGKTTGGTQYIIAKDNLDVSFSVIDSTNTVQVQTWTNVFSELARSTHPNFVNINDIDRTRILLLTGKNIPVQINILERNIRYDFGAGSNTITYSLDQRFRNLSTTKGFVLVDGTLRTVTSTTVVGAADNYISTIVFSGTPATGILNVNIIVPSWNWWAEAVITRGSWNQVASVKFASSGSIPTDMTEGYRTVTIPELLRLGVEEVYNSLTSRSSARPYPYFVTSPGDPSLFSTATYVWVEAPAVNTEWTFTATRSLTGGRQISSPNYVGFGAAVGTGCIITRAWDVKFNGGKNKIQAQHLRGRKYSSSLLEQDMPITLTGTDASLRVASISPGMASIATLNTDTFGWYMSYAGGGTSFSRVEYTAQYAFVNTNFDSRYIGTAAQKGVEVDLLIDGYPYAVGGIHDVADYYSGSFPSCGAVFNNRLVLGGFETAPSTLLVSEVADEHVAGKSYKVFQLQYQEGNATDPFDVDVVFQEPDDRILAIREWQNSLWVFSRYRTYRLLPGSSGFTGDSVQVQAVGAVGVANSRCVVSGDNSLYFLNATGVYQLVPAEGLADSYNVQEVSTKIRPEFEKRLFMETTAFLLYDTIRQRLYVFVPKHQKNYCFESYVFFILRQAWAKWSDVRGEGIPAVSGFMYYPNLNTSKLCLNMLVHPSRFNSASFTATTDVSHQTLSKPAFRIGVYPNQFHVDRLLYASWFVNTSTTISVDTASANSPFKLNDELCMLVPFLSLAGTEFPTSASLKRYYDGSIKTKYYDAAGFNIHPSPDVDDVAVGTYNSTNGAFAWLHQDYWRKTTYGSIQILNALQGVPGANFYVLQPKTTVRYNYDRLDITTPQVLPRLSFLRWEKKSYYAGTPANGLLDTTLYFVQTNYPVNSLTTTKPGVDFASEPDGATSLSTYSDWTINYLFPSYHTTITMNRGTIANAKKLVRFHGYYQTNSTGESRIFTEDLPSVFSSLATLIGTRSSAIEVTIYIRYNDEAAGYIITDVFGSDALSSDVAPFQDQDYTRLTVPLFGSGYNFDVSHYNCQASTFTLVGFQLDARMRPGKQYGRAD